jgi:ribosomal protein S18
VSVWKTYGYGQADKIRNLRNYMAKIFKHKTDVAYFDYKDFKTLQSYVNVYGQIETRKKTGLTESQLRFCILIRWTLHSTNGFGA